MRHPTHTRILDVIESNPAQDMGGVPLRDVAEAMDMSVTVLLRHLTNIEDDGDCLVHEIGGDRTQWRVTSIRPNPT